MKLKSTVLLSIFLILIATLSVVSANDNFDNQTLELEDNDLTFEQNVTKTFNDIQNEIDKIDENGTIELEGLYEGNGTAITITKAVTIEGKGNGATLDAKKLSSIMKINSNNVILKNLKFVNGLGIYKLYNNREGGSITWNGDNGKVINSTFLDSLTYEDGGAIRWEGNNFNVINSTFVNCCYSSYDYSVPFGGSLYLKGNNVTIDNCKFNNNTDDTYEYSDTSIIYAKVNNLKIVNSNFEDLRLHSRLIMLTKSKEVEINNCIFRNITPVKYNQQSKGVIRADYLSYFNITNCTFEDMDIAPVSNIMSQIGSAAYVTNSNFITIDRCRFYNQTVTLGCIIISNSNTTLIKNSIFSDSQIGSGLIDINSCNDTILLNNDFLNIKAISSLVKFFKSPYTLIINNTFNNLIKLINEPFAISSEDINNNSKIITCTFPDRFSNINVGSEVEIIKKTVDVLVDDISGEYGNIGNCSMTLIDRFTNKPFSNQTVKFFIEDHLTYLVNLKTDENGQIFINMTSDDYTKYLNGGLHNARVYLNNDNYNFTKIFKINVNPVNLDLNITDNRQLYIGYSTQFTGTSKLGYYYFKDNEIVKLYVNDEYIENSTIKGAVTFKSYTFNEAKNYTVKMVFEGSRNFKATNSTHIFKILKRPVRIIFSSYSWVYVGDESKIGVSLRADYGKVNEGKLQYYINGALGDYINVTDQDVYFSYIYPHSGKHNLTVKYIGGEIFADSDNSTIEFTVNPISCELKINDSVFNKYDNKEMPILLKDVKDRPLSNLEVVLYLNAHTLSYTGITDSQGIALVNISDLKPGEYTASAEFLGNSDYHHGFSNSAKIIIKSPTEINMTSPQELLYGTQSIFDINVIGEDGEVKDGNVTVNINNREIESFALNSSNIHFEYLFEKAGKYNLTVIFKDSAYFEDSNKTIEVTVNKMPTILEVSDVSFVQGNVSLQAKLTDVNGIELSKAIIFNVTDLNNQTVDISSMKKGKFNYYATFDGDENYIESKSDVKTITIKTGTKITIEAIENALSLKPINLKANISDSEGNIIEGVLKYYINDDQVFGNFTPMTSGKYTLKVVFNGDEYHASSQNMLEFTVGDGRDDAQIIAKDMSATYNIASNLKIVLKSSKGNAVGNVDVEITFNGLTKKYTTDKNGEISIAVKQKPGKYPIKIVFKGNTYYKSASKTVHVTVKKATPKITAKAKTFKAKTKTKKYSITLKDNTGKAIKDANVKLKVKGKLFKAKTNSKGKATFKVKVAKIGTFKSTVKFAGNKYYNKLSKTVKIKIKK